MPSLFPGIDSYIEGQLWPDFHSRLASVLSDAIVPRIVPRYVVRLEERVYVETTGADGPISTIRPDITIVERETRYAGRGGGAAVAVKPAEAVKPVSVTLPVPEEVTEWFLTIRERDSDEIVTVIEILSPANKRAGSDGRREYLSKRNATLHSAAHLVEIDLLRGGERLPTLQTLPNADGWVFIARAERLYSAEAWPVLLRHPLPEIPIPLLPPDPDIPLNLQEAANTVYERARYDFALNYARPIEPPLTEDDSAWARDLLASAASSSASRQADAPS